MSERRPTLDQRGLTLLELLITLLILCMIGVIVVEAFRLVSRSWEKGERFAETEQRVRVVYGTLVQDLATVRPIAALIGGKPVVAFRGTEDRIVFHAAPDRYQALPYGAMVRSLAYFVEPGTGLVVQESYPLIEGRVSVDARGTVKVIEPKATRINLRYLVPPPLGERQPLRWVGAWPVEAARATPVVPQLGMIGTAASPSASGLPFAVEVTVALAEAGVEREWSFVVPIQVGRRI